MLDKFITCAVFRPGSIIITGGNNLVEYNEDYIRRMVNLLGSHLDNKQKNRIIDKLVIELKILILILKLLNTILLMLKRTLNYSWHNVRSLILEIKILKKF